MVNTNGRIIYDEAILERSEFSIEVEEGDYKLNVVAPKYKPELFDINIQEDKLEHVLELEPSSEFEDILRGASTASKDVITELLEDETPPKIFAEQGKIYFMMPPIYFKFNKWKLTDESKVLLDQLIAKLKRHPTLRITIYSHTDSRGSEAYNQKLSEKRAQSTVNYILKKGLIERSRVSFKAYGETMLAIECTEENCTEEQHAKNRRSEFEITDY